MNIKIRLQAKRSRRLDFSSYFSVFFRKEFPRAMAERGAAGRPEAVKRGWEGESGVGGAMGQGGG